MEYTKVNLRGTIFLTTSQTFKAFLDGKHKTCRDIVSKENEYFVDKNPAMFHSILDFYAHGHLHVPAYVCPIQALEDLQFWGVKIDHIPPCCYKTIYSDDTDSYKAMACINKSVSNTCMVNPEQDNKMEWTKKKLSPREWLLRVYDDPFGSIAGKIFAVFIALNIIISLIVFALNTCESTRDVRDKNVFQQYNLTISSTNMKMIIKTKASVIVSLLDLTTNTILLLDLFIRFLIARKKRLFFIDPVNILEVLSGVSAYVIVYVDGHPEITKDYSLRKLMIIAGVLYSMRVIKILRVASFSIHVRILKLSLLKSCHELFLFVVIVLSFSTVFGSMMYWSEFESSNNAFTDLFVSMWWALITMTTVGYGDYYPKSPQGYFVGGITAMSGILLLAILANKFNTFYTCNVYKTKHEEMSDKRKDDLKESSQWNSIKRLE